MEKLRIILKKDIKWFEEIGFIRIKNIITIIESGIIKGNKFEEIFQNEIIEYFNSLFKENLKQ